MAAFKIGINMAGAISAGAYTAGVLDFLIEALDEWYKAKARGEAVPTHDVSIEVFSGASAGGMCAAISAVLLQQDFEHIHDTSKRSTNNRFYESWVNQIDITELLQTDDLKPSEPVCSLLNSNIIERIAKYALTSDGPLPPPRPYVSPDLTLYLSLTNLRGTPYSLNAAAPGSIEETTFFYADRICFRTTRTSAHRLCSRATSTPSTSPSPALKAAGTSCKPPPWPPEPFPSSCTLASSCATHPSTSLPIGRPSPILPPVVLHRFHRTSPLTFLNPSPLSTSTAASPTTIPSTSLTTTSHPSLLHRPTAAIPNSP